jgi:hypothetical protein
VVLDSKFAFRNAVFAVVDGNRRVENRNGDALYSFGGQIEAVAALNVSFFSFSKTIITIIWLSQLKTNID